MWDNGESSKVRSRQRSRQRGEEPERSKVMEKRTGYYNDLQKMVTDQSEQKRSNRATKIEREKEVGRTVPLMACMPYNTQYYQVHVLPVHTYTHTL